MREPANRLRRRALASVSGLLGRNAFVYERTRLAGVARPDIRVRPVEFYGQCGEDLILVALVRAEAFNRGVDSAAQLYLEVGGNHPFATSPTYLMHKQLGMHGVIVEANPALLPDLRKGRPQDTIVHGAVQTTDVDHVTLTVSKLSEISSLNTQWVEQWEDGRIGVATRVDVPALRMNNLVAEFLDGRAPCFLSIDVETLDLQLLRDFDFQSFRPWIVQAEPSERFLPGETRRMVEYMRSVDYALVAMTDVNLIFADARD